MMLIPSGGVAVATRGGVVIVRYEMLWIMWLAPRSRVRREEGGQYEGRMQQPELELELEVQ